LVLPVLLRLAADLERHRFSRARGAELVSLLASVLDEALPASRALPPLRSTRRIVLPAALASPVAQLARGWLVRVLREAGFAAELGAREAAPGRASAEPGPPPILVLSALGQQGVRRAIARAQQLIAA